MAADHKYRIKYDIGTLPGDGMTKAQMQADPALEGYGGTDAMCMFSIIHTPEGGKSIAVNTRDGRTDEAMPADDQFEMFMILARKLATGGQLDGDREAFCWGIWNAHIKSMGLDAQDLNRARLIDAGNKAGYRSSLERQSDEDSSEKR